MLFHLFHFCTLTLDSLRCHVQMMSTQSVPLSIASLLVILAIGIVNGAHLNPLGALPPVTWSITSSRAIITNGFVRLEFDRTHPGKGEWNGIDVGLLMIAM